MIFSQTGRTHQALWLASLTIASSWVAPFSRLSRRRKTSSSSAVLLVTRTWACYACTICQIWNCAKDLSVNRISMSTLANQWAFAKMLMGLSRSGTRVEREQHSTSILCFLSRITIRSCGNFTTSKTSFRSRASRPRIISSSTALMIRAFTSQIWERPLVPIHHVITTSVTWRTMSWPGAAVVNAYQVLHSPTASHTPTVSHAPTWKATMITCQMSRSSCSMWPVPGVPTTVSTVA